MGVSLRLRFGSACCGLRYRFGAMLRSALLMHPSHASRSSILTPYLICIHTFALPCFMLIIKHLKG
ncbi:MAG: hypothetical protein RML94_07210 [Bacteroidia bacterium]|nr:hypothetical protein [Bacteroidia bacterium]